MYANNTLINLILKRNYLKNSICLYKMNCREGQFIFPKLHILPLILNLAEKISLSQLSKVALTFLKLVLTSCT